MFKFSAEDIANQQFETKFRGYDPDQVREFLEGLARQWRDIQKSYRRMEQRLNDQADELEEYRRREKSLVEALETARQVADDIRDKADRDAERIMAETELKAEKMLARAEKRVSELRGELFDLREQRSRLHSEMRQMLDSYESMLDRYEQRAAARAERQGEGEEGHPLPPVPGGDHREVAREVDDEDIEREVDVEEADDQDRPSA